MVVAEVNIEMTAFNRARGLTLLLDGMHVQTLTVEPRRGVHRIGPLALTPGVHALVFHPTEAPTVADQVMHNGDSRPLSFAAGTWEWTVRDF